MSQYPAVVAPPRGNFDTNRSLVKFILLGLLTLGIYALWVTARAGEDLNSVAGRWDNKRSMNYWLLALLVGPITLGIAQMVWWHKTSGRIRNELRRRGLQPTVTPADFWLWGTLGILIVIGPYVFMHRWLKAMNQLCADYNFRG
ncbi:MULTISPECIES: DUF4234 domain-containing protein [unclassified Pseudactinotalea]|uniref:DUF4234 domain-containing protein n=1 Tax=unclassified Pseudactinotalea TaxID=2649176 RepID=UPI00128C8EFA|nr:MULTISPECIES: DUF4234 domain-containing protein [unclassified Pseudactinotalea]MPV49858.1 DUF4234 domain-containing protein [Pseudactinotalea sp. HY160]QGH69126.1 DUF4234 domain-containing protein [Pseudactinotalea sp. HY158]